MKNILFIIQLIALIFITSAIFGAGTKDKEISSLNSLKGSQELLTMSGGRCWWVTEYNPYSTHEVCVDDADSSSSGGGFVGPWGMPISLGFVGVLCGSFVENGWWEYGALGVGLGLIIDAASGAF